MADPVIDGTPNSRLASYLLEPTVTITTTAKGMVIVDIITSGAGPVVSVIGSTLGAFSLKTSSPSGASTIERWYKWSNDALTDEVITITLTTATFSSSVGYCVSNINENDPWDSGSGQVDNTHPADPLSITTHIPKAFVLAAFEMTAAAGPTAGTGFSPLASGGAGYFLSEYKLQETEDTVSCTITTGATDSARSIADALNPASARGPNMKWTAHAL